MSRSRREGGREEHLFLTFMMPFYSALIWSGVPCRRGEHGGLETWRSASSHFDIKYPSSIHEIWVADGPNGTTLTKVCSYCSAQPCTNPTLVQIRRAYVCACRRESGSSLSRNVPLPPPFLPLSGFLIQICPCAPRKRGHLIIIPPSSFLL